ncbi:phenazine biosynthesis-like domain-containing protein 2 isoform X2 [Trichomycterus rosablanca]|uniref:phenazine biosynthesis-like domain-containing protein 2 isoform X2 n=1 Tax=Trichomycterus rosablanca TaxID=2290929 RepID=UPI002F357B66
MEIPVFTVDAFTNLPFKGNPAAVCLLENELPVEFYQKIAAEMNLSETAFITKLKSTDDFCSGARFGLRWFTPKNEVELCGHATLASSAVLFYKKGNTSPVLVFETLSGELLVRQRGESLVMDFPLNKPEIQDPKNFKDLLKERLISSSLTSNTVTDTFVSPIYLTCTSLDCGRKPELTGRTCKLHTERTRTTPPGNRSQDLLAAAVGDLPIQDVCYSKSIKKLLVRLSDSCDRSALTSLNPVTESLLSIEKSGNIKSIVITVKGATTTAPGYDFFSRNFAPWHGIPEDPVTGSAHTVLVPYWSEKLGKKKMLAYQCSRRGGELQLELRDDNRVDIAGQAVVILEGTLKL